MNKIKLANMNGFPEIFHSIQGEGKNMGNPSVFIRTSLCNLHCIWCDTDYTWNWEKTRFKHNKDVNPDYKKYKMGDMIIELYIEDIYDIVQQTNCFNIVLTGGEPMLQQEELTSLMTYFKNKDDRYFFEIETNGTIKPTIEFDELINQYNVSPKLENSNNSKSLREKPNVYHFFSNNDKAVFKYVISNKTDLAEVLELMNTYSIQKNRTYLMPEGINQKELKEKQLWLIDICKMYSINYTDRLHIHIFGDKRGV